MVVQAIVKQVLEQQPTELPGTIQKLAECVTVNYSVSDLTATIDGVSYTITIQDKWDEMMELVKQGKDPSVLNETTMGGGQAANNTESSSAAASTTGTAAGYSTTNTTGGTAE